MPVQDCLPYKLIRIFPFATCLYPFPCRHNLNTLLNIKIYDYENL